MQKLCHEAEYYLNILLKVKRDQLLEKNEHYFSSVEEPSSTETDMNREQTEVLNASDNCSPTPEVQSAADNNGLTCNHDQVSDDNTTMIPIKLSELLKFPRITALCSSTEELRCGNCNHNNNRRRWLIRAVGT